MSAISFFAIGTPVAQPRARAAAKKIFVNGQPKWIGHVYNPTDADQWKRDVAFASKPHIPKEPMTGPVELELTLYLPRVKGHYGTGKNEGRLKESAPMYQIDHGYSNRRPLLARRLPGGEVARG
jgi:hypothetical protein